MSEMQQIVALSQAWSRARREQIPALFESLGTREQYGVAVLLLQSEHRDVRDYVLEFATQSLWHDDEHWRDALSREIEGVDLNTQGLFAQQLFVLLSHWEARYIGAALKARLYDALSVQNDDLRYHALVALEQSLEEGPRYWELLLETLKDKDADLRIVASQALGRLGNSEALPALKEAARYSFGVEAFHLLLARLNLGETGLDAELCEALRSDVTTYAALLAIEKYGTERCLESLSQVWQSPFTEPTVRITAARCAAKLGSHDAVELLRELAQKKSGNPELAIEALGMI